MKKVLFKNTIVIYFLALTLGGCFVLSHPEEVAFLQDLAESQNRMQEQVSREEKLYYELISDIKNNRIKKGTSKDEILSLYGEPIFCRPLEKDKTKESCLYRNPAKFFGGDLLYLYFDESRNLIDWNLCQPE
jgi:hypothetical protein